MTSLQYKEDVLPALCRRSAKLVKTKLQSSKYKTALQCCALCCNQSSQSKCITLRAYTAFSVQSQQNTAGQKIESEICAYQICRCTELCSAAATSWCICTGGCTLVALQCIGATSDKLHWCSRLSQSCFTPGVGTMHNIAFKLDKCSWDEDSPGRIRTHSTQHTEQQRVDPSLLVDAHCTLTALEAQPLTSYTNEDAVDHHHPVIIPGLNKFKGGEECSWDQHFADCRGQFHTWRWSLTALLLQTTYFSSIIQQILHQRKSLVPSMHLSHTTYHIIFSSFKSIDIVREKVKKACFRCHWL